MIQIPPSGFGPPTSRAGTTTEKLLNNKLQAPGKIIKAWVIKQLPDNRYLLKGEERLFTVRSATELKTGQELQLRLSATSPEIAYTVQSASTTTTSLPPLIALSGQFLDNNEFTALIEQLLRLQNSALSKSLTAFLDLSRLLQRSFPDQSGGRHLQMLFGLLGNDANRGSISKLLTEIIKTGSAHEELGKCALDLNSRIECFQLCQAVASERQQLLFPLPLAFIEQGFLTIDHSPQHKSKNQHSKQDVLRANLYLNLKGLGDLRIEIRSLPEGYFITFFAESASKAKFLAGFSDTLKHNPENLPILGLKFHEGARSPVAELEQLLHPTPSAINITA